MIELRVADDFSPFLGGRYRDDGPWSGEAFRDDFLKPKVLDAIRGSSTVHVVFDGVAGMPSSFLEEAFGGLLRVLPDVDVRKLTGALKLDAKDPELWPFLQLAVKYMEQQAARPH